jgi:DNA-binding PadR family transcriptional regulator
MSFRYFILGLLAQQPMSGYDIKGYLGSLHWLVGSPSFGSVYPSLHALLKKGLVNVEVVQNEDRPARKVYSVTEEGRQVLQKWISKPLDSSGSLKAFLMRLMLANSLSHTGLVACLQQRRSQVEAHRAALAQAIEAHDRRVGFGQDLAFDFALTAAIAELGWLDRTLERLSHECPEARPLGEGVYGQQPQFDASRQLP